MEMTGSAVSRSRRDNSAARMRSPRKPCRPSPAPRSSRLVRRGLHSLFALALCIAGCGKGKELAGTCPDGVLMAMQQVPAWNPVESRIMYKAIDGVLCMMDSTGQDLGCFGVGDTPKWSIDGSQLVVSILGEIALYDYASGQKTYLTRGSRDYFPSLSRDGTMLAYTCAQEAFGIRVKRVDDPGRGERLSLPFAYTMGPSWSPTSDEIVFAGTPDDSEHWNIWVVNADGSGLKELTRGGVENQYPVWSPDGQRIAYTSNEGVHLMNADGTDQRLLAGTGEPCLNAVPSVSWCGDGKRLVYNKQYLWIIGVDGSGNREIGSAFGQVGVGVR